MDYPPGLNVIPRVFKSRGRQKRGQKVMRLEEKAIRCKVPDFAAGGMGPPAKECGCPQRRKGRKLIQLQASRKECSPALV